MWLLINKMKILFEVLPNPDPFRTSTRREVRPMMGLSVSFPGCIQYFLIFSPVCIVHFLSVSFLISSQITSIVAFGPAFLPPILTWSWGYNCPHSAAHIVQCCTVHMMHCWYMLNFSIFPERGWNVVWAIVLGYFLSKILSIARNLKITIIIGNYWRMKFLRILDSPSMV